MRIARTPSAAGRVHSIRCCTPALSDDQQTALLSASKSSVFYTPMNRPGGASSETWQSVRAAYPVLDGVDDAALQAAFANLKAPAASAAVSSPAPPAPFGGIIGSAGSAFDKLRAPQKVALVRAVRNESYYAATFDAAEPSAVWATLRADWPELADLSDATLEEATAILTSMEGAGTRTPSATDEGVTSGAVPLVFLAVVTLTSLAGFKGGDLLCAADATAAACLK